MREPTTCITVDIKPAERPRVRRLLTVSIATASKRIALLTFQRGDDKEPSTFLATASDLDKVIDDATAARRALAASASSNIKAD